jgi:hypothetical protein
MSYSVLTRFSMKIPNSLMSTTSLQCPLFQVFFFCFLLDLFFKIVKAVSYQYTPIITRLSNSHFYILETDAINGINGTIITYGQVSIASYTYTPYPD